MLIASLESRTATPATFNPGLPARQVDARLRAALEELQAAQRSAVLWFAEVLSRGLFRELGYSSIHAYAAESLASGVLPWTKAVEVARVATPKTEKAWIEEAQRTGRRELARRVGQVKARARVVRQADPTQTGLTLVGTDTALPLVEATVMEAPVSVTFDFTPEQYARYEALMEKARKKGERGSREELLLAALELLAGHAESSRVTSNSIESSRLDSGADGADRGAAIRARIPAPQPRYQVVVTHCPDCGRADAQTSRGPKPLGLPALQAILCDARVEREGAKNQATIPPARRREVFTRDGYRCRASGCGSAHFLDVHHVIPRERGGTNDPDNLITLCASCHRFIHERKHAAG